LGSFRSKAGNQGQREKVGPRTGHQSDAPGLKPDIRPEIEKTTKLKAEVQSK
jgi:hypothetical protein